MSISTFVKLTSTVSAFVHPEPDGTWCTLGMTSSISNRLIIELAGNTFITSSIRDVQMNKTSVIVTTVDGMYTFECEDNMKAIDLCSVIEFLLSNSHSDVGDVMFFQRTDENYVPRFMNEYRSSALYANALVKVRESSDSNTFSDQWYAPEDN